jgi:hypothetical protein
MWYTPAMFGVVLTAVPVKSGVGWELAPQVQMFSIEASIERIAGGIVRGPSIQTPPGHSLRKAISRCSWHSVHGEQNRPRHSTIPVDSLRW